VYYQALADGNGRDDVLNPGAFVINEVHRFIETYSDPGMQIGEIKRMIAGAIYCANRVLLAFKRANKDLYASSFSSLDLTAVFDGNKFISAHVGDSRGYLLREGKMHLLTKDHTEAQRLCDEGKISKEQIFIHPERDILTSALGYDNPRVDIREGKIKKGDIILLLTDGAHKVLSPEQIQNIVFSAGNCYDTCNGIIEGANLLGGPDNISVCVTYIPD
jgi:serine/threonine protein phosphatase PrpC